MGFKEIRKGRIVKKKTKKKPKKKLADPKVTKQQAMHALGAITGYVMKTTEFEGQGQWYGHPLFNAFDRLYAFIEKADRKGK